MSHHILNCDKCRVDEVAHLKVADAGSFEAVVESNGEVLQAIGHAGQCGHSHCIVSWVAACYHEEGFVGDVTNPAVSIGGDDMGCFGGFAAVPDDVPTMGHSAEGIPNGSRDPFKIYHERDVSGAAVNHLDNYRRRVRGIEIADDERDGVDAPC